MPRCNVSDHFQQNVLCDVCNMMIILKGLNKIYDYIEFICIYFKCYTVSTESILFYYIFVFLLIYQMRKTIYLCIYLNVYELLNFLKFARKTKIFNY